MRIDRGALKYNARLSMRETQPRAIWVAIVFILITYALSALSGLVTDEYEHLRELVEMVRTMDYSAEFLEEYREFMLHSPQIGLLGNVIDLALSIMSLILSVGFMLYTLNVSRRAEAGFGNLFDGFGMFGRIILAQIICYVRVFLWSLLLVVPGIIESYRQRQVFYLLMDNPDKRVTECIRESREMMVGHKWELFVLDLSFLGWYILSVIPFVTFWTTPYINTTYSCYYNALIGLNSQYEGDVPPAPPVYDPSRENGDERPPWEQ